MEIHKDWVERAHQVRISSRCGWTEKGTAIMTKVSKFDSLGKAGVKVEDEVIGLDGAPLAGEEDFFKRVGTLGVGAKATLRVRRGSQILELEMTLLKARKLNFDLDEVQVDLERKIAPA